MAEGILKLGCPYVFNMDMKLPVNGVLPVIAPWGTLTAVPLTVKPGDIEGYRRWLINPPVVEVRIEPYTAPPKIAPLVCPTNTSRSASGLVGGSRSARMCRIPLRLKGRSQTC